MANLSMMHGFTKGGKCGCLILINKRLFEVNLPYGQSNFMVNPTLWSISLMDNPALRSIWVLRKLIDNCLSPIAAIVMFCFCCDHSRVNHNSIQSHPTEAEQNIGKVSIQFAIGSLQQSPVLSIVIVKLRPEKTCGDISHDSSKR